MQSVTEIAAWLDAQMQSDSFEDDSRNGLQVANSGRIGLICAGVDASLSCFEAAAALGAGMLICHHGISWGDSLCRLTGLNYRLVSFLMQHDMALWACHLPLDAHARLGNNARLAHRLGLRDTAPFCRYHGQCIGIRGELPQPLPLPDVVNAIERATRSSVRIMPFGPTPVRTIGVVSGGAAAEVAQAAEAGLDLYLSGEPTLQGFNLAQQLGMNAVFAGHYATERFGVRALAAELRGRFGLPTRFIDLNLPY